MNSLRKTLRTLALVGLLALFLVALFRRDGMALLLAVAAFAGLIFLFTGFSSRKKKRQGNSATSNSSSSPSQREAEGWEGLHSKARANGQEVAFRNTLQQKLPLPAEVLREPILSLYDHLAQLQTSVAAMPEPKELEAGFRSDLGEEMSESFGALWSLCDQLSGVAEQKVRFPDDHPSVQALLGKLEGLSEAAQKMRIRLAEGAMARLPDTLEEAEISLRTLARQADSLRSLELES